MRSLPRLVTARAPSAPMYGIAMRWNAWSGK